MDFTQALADGVVALQDVFTLAGQPSPMDQLVTANAALTAAQTSLAAITTDDNALKAQLAKIRQDLVAATQDAA